MLTKFRNTMLLVLTFGGLAMFTAAIYSCEPPRSNPESGTAQEIIASKVAKKELH